MCVSYECTYREPKKDWLTFLSINERNVDPKGLLLVIFTASPWLSGPLLLWSLQYYLGLIKKNPICSGVIPWFEYKDNQFFVISDYLSKCKNCSWSGYILGKFCGTSHPDNQGFGCTGCKNFWSTSVNVVVYLGSSYFTIFLLCVEVDTILYQLVIMSHTFQMFCFVNLWELWKWSKMLLKYKVA